MTAGEGAFDFINGEILLFDKPYGWTSFDLVGKVRNFLSRELKIRKIKVGHAGTLDPLATGLMVICTGKATKQVDQFQAQEKHYTASLKLGATTPSFDRETQEDQWFSTEHITAEMLEEKLRLFEGPLQQIPPAFSAVKIDGKRAYEHARKGRNPELKPKLVVISEINMISFNMPEVILGITCSKGTYIRALARDIGSALGSGAYLTALRRTRSGSFNVEEAMTYDEFRDQVIKWNSTNNI
jgi:tRNA pseudouridine55 synthase